jgi:hypothetical protein
MQAKDFELFKWRYKESSKTQSTNPAILELYAFLLKNEVVDSDVWTVGGGNDAVVSILEKYFSDRDWEELETELENWTTQQLEIFTESILEGSGQNEEDEVLSTVKKRFLLLKKLLHIAQQRDIRGNDILLSLTNNIAFLDKCHFMTKEDATEIANYLNTPNE